MYELIGQLLAAIFGTISVDKNLRSKHKVLLSFFVGAIFFTGCLIAEFFVFDQNEITIIPELVFSSIMSISFYLIILLDEYLTKRKLRKQKKNNNKLE